VPPSFICSTSLSVGTFLVLATNSDLVSNILFRLKGNEIKVDVLRKICGISLHRYLIYRASFLYYV
jgi:hypothetical protein